MSFPGGTGLAQAWPDIIGPWLAPHVRLGRLEDGTLTIRLFHDDPDLKGLVETLVGRAPEIIGAANIAIGRQAVTRLRIVGVREPAAKPERKSPSRPRKVRAEYTEVGKTQLGAATDPAGSALQTMPYHEYLTTPEWRAKRAAVLERAGHRCQLCGVQGVTLDAHHNSYARRGCEDLVDLIALCRPCHESFHKSRPGWGS